jgi:polar amino acid transport system substrate-binding protein
MRPVFVERDAVAGLLRQNKADAAQRGTSALRDGEGVYYASQPTLPYRNVAVTLKRLNLGVYSVADLRNKSVISFPGARQFLGAEYDAIVKHNPHYVELLDEQGKLGLLLDGSAQVYVGDVNLFNWLLGSVPNPPEAVVHHIFLPTRLVINNAVFRDARVRDDFNAGLQAIQENGLYQQIVHRYIK